MTSKFKRIHKICSALKFLTIFDAEIMLKFYKVLRQRVIQFSKLHSTKLIHMKTLP